ncbi:MAG: hypothetical protein U9R02_00635 [Thermodesulfobacteriota bacterium]|nr:hypothetical protein [Thermodesulfobacteriota bacterium]
MKIELEEKSSDIIVSFDGQADPPPVRRERVSFNDINLLVPSPLGERVRVRGISYVRDAKAKA